MPLLPTLHAISAVHCPLGFVQQVTAIIQAPGFDSLSPCAQNIVVAVIDDSKSPECPGGSPPYCFCGAEAASQEYFDQISTNILKSCLTSPQPEAMQAATVFAAYCSLEDAMTAGTTAASSSSPTSSSSSYSLSSSSSEARTTTSSAAHGASSISTSTSGPTSSSNGGGVLNTSDIVARGVNISGTVDTIVGGIGSIVGSPPRPTSSSNDSTTSSGNGGRGLNTGDKVGLGIGIPAAVAGIIAAYYAYKTYMLSKKHLAVGMHS